MKTPTLYDRDTFELEGLTFKVYFEADECMGMPWENSDCHGPVRKAKPCSYTGHISKSPGERVLHRGDRNCHSWVYDWNAATAQALRDGWGLSDDKKTSNWATLSKAQQTQLIVQADFDYLQGWCNDDWCYLSVGVHLLDADSNTVESEYLGGVESLGDYSTEVAHELAQGMAQAHIKERAEVQAWAERDVVTTA